MRCLAKPCPAPRMLNLTRPTLRFARTRAPARGGANFVNFRSAPLQIRSNFACMPATFPQAPPSTTAPRADLAVGNLHHARLWQQFRRARAEGHPSISARTLEAATWGCERQRRGPGADLHRRAYRRILRRSQSHRQEIPRQPDHSYRSRYLLRMVGEVDGMAGPHARAAPGDEGLARQAGGRRRRRSLTKRRRRRPDGQRRVVVRRR